MGPSVLASQLMATFLEELDEHVRVLNRELLALEKEPGGPATSVRVTALLRTAHSLKGASRAVNLSLLEVACHHVEEILIAVRDGQRPFGTELCGLVLTFADGLEDAARRLRAQQGLAQASIGSMLVQLEAAARGNPIDTPTPRAPSAERPRNGPAHPSPEPIPSAEAGGAAAVRVSAERLDALLAHAGELLVAWHRLESRRDELVSVREMVSRWKSEWRGTETRPRAGAVPRGTATALAQTGERLRRLEKELEWIGARLTRDGHLLGQAAARLGDDVRRVRMLPFAEACAGLQRAVRDLARAGAKDVDVVVEGGDVELDRSILEGLRDPLLHLVRNAVDHGIEAPAGRRAEGKSPRARITVSAALRGARVAVVVADDGRGLDLVAVREQARKRGLAESESDHELARLVFEPGLSTAPIITDVSGRGVGLDVVKSRLEALNGSVDVTSEPGRGTRFTMSVPLTLTTLRALLVSAGGQTFAIAGASVEALARLRWSELRAVQSREMLVLGGRLVPVVSLAATLGLRVETPAATDAKAPALIVAAGERRVALAVDELLAEQEVVVKSLGPRLRNVRSVSGATVLPSGRVALVLNTAHLVRTALGRAPGQSATATAEEGAVAAKRVLVVDDSVTTRTLEKSILETAGYEVAVAADGEIAWQMLQENGADIIVSDVEMPRMDGFGLTEAVRGSLRFRKLPVVLVTGRESEGDKARGMQVGADAYLVKSAFDQKALLDTIAQLL